MREGRYGRSGHSARGGEPFAIHGDLLPPPGTTVAVSAGTDAVEGVRHGLSPVIPFTDAALPRLGYCT